MRQIDDPKFRAILASFGEVYSKQISPQLASLFWEALKDLPIEAVDQGACRWIKHSKNFPRPSNIRDMIAQLAQAAPKQITDERDAQEPQDHLLFFANRLFLKHLVTREGFGSTATFKSAYGLTDIHASRDLIDARKKLRELVAEFCGYICEGDELATPAAFIEILCKSLKIPIGIYVQILRDPRSAEAFPQFMGRQLHARYSRAA